MAVKFLNGIDVDGSMNIAASDVPNLDASKITSGTFSADRIPTGLYQPAGDYLDLETANITFQPIGNYLTTTGKAADSNLLDGINSTQFVRSDTNSVTIGRHLDANTTWTNSALTLFLGWYGGKLVIGNNNDGGHDYASALGGNTIPILNNTYFWKTAKFEEDVQTDGKLNVLARTGTWITSNVMADSIGWNVNHGVYIGSNVGGTHYLRANGKFTTGGSTYDLWHEGNFNPTDKASTESVAAVNARIDTEVFDAIGNVAGSIPTNNNQLTNGAGYTTQSNTDLRYASAGKTNAHTSFSDLNQNPSVLGWTYYQGTTNSPHNGNQGGYKLRVGLGSDYGTNTGSSGHYAMEMLMPRTSQATSGIGYLYMRQMESGNWDSWSKVKAGYADSTPWSGITGKPALATESYVNTAVSNLVASAPATLDTLNELAAALGDDANFSTTVANNIGAIDTRINDEVMPYIASVETIANSKLDATAKAADSNLLDGINSTSFLRSDQADTMSGTLTITGSNGVSRLRIEGTTPTIDLDDADGDSFYIHVNSNNFYVLTDRDGGGDYGTWESPHPLQLEADTNSAYIFGNKLNSAAYAATTAFDSAGSAAAVSTALNERIDTEVFGAIGDVAGTIPTNNNQLTNGAGYITSADGGNAATLEGRRANDFLKANDGELSNTDLNTLYDDDSTLYFSNSEYSTNSNIPYNNYFTLLNLRNPYGDNTGDAANANDRGTQLWFGDTPGRFYIRYFQGSAAWHPWEQVWTSQSLKNVSQLTNDSGYLTSIPSTYATDAEVGTAVGVVDTRINDEVIPYIDAVAADASKGAVAHGWGDHSAAGYLTSLSAHNHDGSYDPIGSADAVALQVNTRIDQEVIPAINDLGNAIPTNNNQLLNGAGYITAVPSSFSTNSITIGNGVTLSESTDRADLLMIKSSTSTWGGLQISNTSNEIIFSMMGDGNVIGLYDDLNNDWVIQRDENGSMRFYADASNTVTVTTSGLSVTGAITASGDVTAFSDARVKENVETLSNALESVKQMRGVTYNKIGEEKQSVGVIAQELEEVVPQLVHTDEEGMKSVAYGNITAVLIEALKEQQAQIEELKARLDGLTK